MNALVVALGLVCAPELEAQEELTSMSLESLMDVQVTSVSRRREELQSTAAAIYVINREDIRRSGATDIADLLRMVPGVQVAQLNGSVWAISARGFASRYATKMLVLVDGRSVYDPGFSGVYWHLQNLVLSDIDRIEVIRGPGATMWGSNGVNGVVNVITQSAANTQKGFLTFDAGTARPAEGTLRYGGAIGERASYRVFARQTNRSSLTNETGSDAGDAWRLTTAGMRLDWDISERDTLTLDAEVYDGYQDTRQEVLTSLAPLGYRTVGREENSGAHVRMRFSRDLGEDSTLALQLYYDHRQHAGFDQKTMNIFDFETQYDFSLGDRHRFTLGGGHRTIHDVFGTSFAFSLAEPHLDSALSNLYVQDQMALIDDTLELTVAGKLETSSFTGHNFQPTARLSWRPALRHTIWGSVSRAVRTANRGERGIHFIFEAFEAGPMVGLVTLSGNENTRSEELMAYEAGYRYQSNRRFWFDVASFYNVYNHLSTVEPGLQFVDTESFPPRLVVPLDFGNRMRGETYGAEVAVNYDVNPAWSVRGSYSLLRMRLKTYPESGDVSSVDRIEGSSPANQAYIGSFVTLPHAFEVAAHAYVVGALSAPQVKVPSYTRIDANLTWKPLDELELGLFGQNLFGAHLEFTGYETNTPISTIDRRIFGRISWSF
jgi:iron complex outermembrane receptor protein